MEEFDLTVMSFQDELKKELNDFLNYERNKYPDEEVLTIDMHCHDHNSNVPDELLGRILNVPETWLKTEKLIETLRSNEMNVITITNHNNARSCFEMIEKGMDILTGAEYSCIVPDYDVGIHVLAYGFNGEQEKVLNKLRRNIYNFQRYTRANDIPTVWAHPLYHYSSNGIPPMEFFLKMSCIFERFEVINGQRDTWQNMLVKCWLESLTPEIIDRNCDLFDINPRLYCKYPYKKSFTGGSDSHMGIFSGQTGTRLYLPNLKDRLLLQKPTSLALEAIRKGNMAPFGNHQNAEKLTIAFLDYVCQIAIFKKDPGLMRILLHKGSTMDKLLALFVTNAFSELQQHKVTMRFIELFHNCFTGKTPSISKRMMVPKVYKPVFDEAMKISKARDLKGENMIDRFNLSINEISNKLNNILVKRLHDKISNLETRDIFDQKNLNELIEKLEIPSEFRTLFTRNGGNGKRGNNKMTNPNIAEFLDGLPFPFLASSIILGANFTSAHVMYNNRDLLNSFSKNIGKLNHPQKILWLTDTFDDKNGVSMFLQDMYSEVKKRDLPIDFLVCSNSLDSDDHLIVTRPISEFKLPFYEDQTIRIPNFLEIHNLFQKNEYDRIICSTEGIMGLLAIYLKKAYSVNAYFYIHTDWIMFAQKVLGFDIHNLSRIRRFLRACYHAFDGLFVLNSDHKEWLTGREMGFEKSKVFQTAHWVDRKFVPCRNERSKLFKVNDSDLVLLFSGRLSPEKGVLEIPYIYKQLKLEFPNIKLVFAGTGPAEKELKKQIDDAIFLGWVEHDQLPKIYSSADLLILPSKFDTFSCVVLESMSCGLPVVAYKTKGPKNIIENMKDGYLVSNRKEMIYRITSFLKNPKSQYLFREKAIEKAKTYNPDNIISNLLKDIDISINSIYKKTYA